MRKRIEQFIETEKLTAAEFADNIGVQRSSVSHVLKGRNNPGFSFIQKILEAYPSVNSRWLLTGEGAMYEKANVQNNVKVTSEPNLFSTVNTPEQASIKTVKNIVKSEDPPVYKSGNQAIKTETATAQQTLPLDKKINRVLIFYSDHTFEDFRPAE